MPEINQYTFSHRELTELMIKASNIREGKWLLAINFGLAAGNFGPNENDISPGAVVAITSIGLQRAQEVSPPALVVDAAKVNSTPNAKAKAKSSS